MGICYYKMVKKTLVLGASLNVDRYSNMAVKKLLLNNVDVRALGLRTGLIDKVFIEKDFVKFDKHFIWKTKLVVVGVSIEFKSDEDRFLKCVDTCVNSQSSK